MSHPVKQCLRCSYLLEGLPENRCPECGQPFDPADPSTWKNEGIEQRNRWKVFMVPGPWHWLLFALLQIIVLLIAILYGFFRR